MLRDRLHNLPCLSCAILYSHRFPNYTQSKKPGSYCSSSPSAMFISTVFSDHVYTVDLFDFLFSRVNIKDVDTLQFQSMYLEEDMVAFPCITPESSVV